MNKFVDVILPLPVSGDYTYALPDELHEVAKVGCRVIVPFGKKKYYTGIIVRIHTEPPTAYETKEVSEILDTDPVVLSSQLAFWDWIASYYLCTKGDVYKAALPSGLKLESETKITFNSLYEADSPLPVREQEVLDVITQAGEATISELEKYTGFKNLPAIIRSLLNREAIFVKEQLRESYKPRKEYIVKLNPEIADEKSLTDVFDTIKRARKQTELLMNYLYISGFNNGKESKEVLKNVLLEKSNSTTTILNSLIDKNIFYIEERSVDRLQRKELVTGELNPLNDAQQKAFESIIENWKEKSVCLLHGVTSSGKTEVYIQLIRKVLKEGKQVLYLLPEIALTTQITERLQRIFGNQLGIYHSKFPDAERVEIWKKQLGDDSYDIILGARSSVFLPFRNLGLIIVDEEHENTYKQQDPAPRYQGRNAAIVLASIYNARVLLGTATPSIETYQNALEGKYGLVTLTERYKDIQLPEILPVDIKELIRKKRIKGNFSPFLLEQIRGALERKEQVILFQNRRGFAPMIECRVCGWVPKCKNCDVSLTYHKGINQLTCHYCGYTYQLPHKCPACEGLDLISRGFGTEKVEDDIQMIFPEARIARMDLDTTRTRNAYEKIIRSFQEGEVDILIGTQMVSKGLDFDHVSVVGILNADNMMNFPDFRAHERAYQLMAQVAGRAGRKNKRGLVVLQTKSMEYPVIYQVINNDYLGMFQDQLKERMLFRYPPFYRLIYVYLKSTQQRLVDRVADKMAQRLRSIFGNRILGPDHPPVARVQRLFIKKIIVKIEKGASIEKVREQLLLVQEEMLQEEGGRLVKVYFDVDPM